MRPGLGPHNVYYTYGMDQAVFMYERPLIADHGFSRIEQCLILKNLNEIKFRSTGTCSCTVNYLFFFTAFVGEV